MTRPPGPEAVDVSVVIVNFNTRERTLECLRSLAPVPGMGLEVVLVDNGSTDGSLAAFAAETDLPVRPLLVDAGENLGFARGVNLGARHSRGDHLLLLNPDTTVFPGTIASLLDFARRHPEHGLYGGRTLRADGTTDPSSCWGRMSLWSLTCFATMASTAFRRTALDPESLGRWDRDTVREVPIITGCLLLVPRQVWDHLGGLDEDYFLYGEDAAFSDAAWRAGYRPVVVPGATIVHDVGASTASAGRKRAMVMAGKTTLIRRTWSPPARLLGLALLLVGTWMRASIERLRRRDPDWRITWEMRPQWLPGYPEAEQAIFGRPPRSPLRSPETPL